MKRGFKRLLAFSMASLLLLAGCNNSSNTAETPAEDTSKAGIERLVNKDEVIYATRSFDGNFDPCMGWGEFEPTLMQSKLMSVHGTKLNKDLATEYTVSEDGLTWTFKIRGDVKFHDGKPLTAKDVAFTFNNTKNNGGKIDLTTMAEAVAVDDTTVEFKMNTPFSAFLYVTASLAIVPEHAYGDSASYSKNPIGSGPFKFVQYDEGQQLILERNDDYYGKVPNFKKLVMIAMTEDAAFAAIKAGTVDVAKTNQELAKQVVDGYSIKPYKTYDYRVISFPVVKPGGKTEEGNDIGNAVTSDEAIRKALAIGINRENIVNNVMNGYGEPAYDVFSKFPWGLNEELKDIKDNNKEEAIKILDDAGWVAGEDGIRVKDGVKAEFIVMYGASALDRQAIALAFVEEAKALGISVIPEALDWSEIEARSKQDAIVLGGGRYSPMNISNLYNSKYAKKIGWNNVAAYENADVDKSIEMAIQSRTEEEANKHWKEALIKGGLKGDVVYAPIMYLEHIFFVRDGIDLGEDLVLAHNHGFSLLMDVENWDYKEK